MRPQNASRNPILRALLLTGSFGAVTDCGARTGLTDGDTIGGVSDGGGLSDGGEVSDGRQASDGAANDGSSGEGGTAVNLDVEGDSLEPSLQIDAAGTMHLLYSYSTSTTPSSGCELTGPFPLAARYAECSADCNSPAGWRFATLDMPAAMVSPLVLDSQGRPRFLFTQAPPGPTTSAPGNLIYAACDAGCTTASNWAFVTVGKGLPCNSSSGNIPLGMPIAVDDVDRLWVAFASDDEELTVASCAGGCSDASNWTPVKYPFSEGGSGSYCPRDLALDAAGTVHMTAIPADSGDYFAYIEIALGSSALSVHHLSTSFGLPTRMRVDSLGRPRILHSKAGTPNLSLSKTMVYSSCDDDCAAGGDWSSAILPVPGQSADPGDFVLDSDGLPHIAYASPGLDLSPHFEGLFQALGYATFEPDHDGGPPVWHFTAVQSSSALETGTPELGRQCDEGPTSLFVGPTSIALDAANEARFAFDVSKTDYCPSVSFGSGCPDGLRYATPGQ